MYQNSFPFSFSNIAPGVGGGSVQLGGDWKDFLLDIKKRTSSIKKNRVGVYRYISTSIEYRKRYIERERKVMFYFSNFFIQGKSGGSLCAE
jgi:hypothetical protein